MEAVVVQLKLWHGVNLVLFLSVVTVAAGVTGFFLRDQLWRLGSWAKGRFGWDGQMLFRAVLDHFLRAAAWVTVFFQSGDLRRYFIVIFSTGVALLAWAYLTSGYVFSFSSSAPLRADVAIVVGLIVLSAVGVACARQRMTAVLMLGCVGFGVAALFGLYGAPDLAITQLLVETLTLVLFALAINGLPGLDPSVHPEGWRGLRLALSAAVGVVFTLLTLKALDLDFHEPIANEIAARSLPEGFGRNVVNVILVDFRALDTLGEISVLAVAALGVAAMLAQAGGGGGAGRSPRGTSSVLLASARFTSPAMLVLSVYLLLRGHNEPGGGFIGGLVAAMASVLTHLARPERVLAVFKLRPATLIVLGLVLAVLSGLPGLIVDASYLDAQWGAEFYLPAVGKVKLGTPLVFDTGVFLVVAGVVLQLYEALERSHASRGVSSTSSSTPT